MDVVEWLADLRKQASDAGVGWVIVRSRHHGSIPIAFEEITSRPDDHDLIDYIQGRCK